MTAAVAQVCDGDGAVVGTGFLIAEDLLISCAHVLVDGAYGPGDVVSLVFPRVPGAPSVRGRVLKDGWRDPEKQDIALVRLEHVPTGTAPLSLGSTAGCRGHRIRSLGFPEQAPPGGHFGFATAGAVLPGADSAGDLLQLTGANDLTTGFSGGPILDETTGLVAGMLTAITVPDGYDRGQGIAYATPSAVLREAWPALEVGDVSPYRALEPFTAEHARWFRGREEAVRRVVAGLAGGRRVVLLLGPSGSGKSSLVQAGVLPALAAGRLPGSDRWRQVVARPGSDLSAALEQAGLPGAGTAGVEAAVIGLLAADPAHDRVVLVIDQFEELLATPAEPQALQALADIAEAIRCDAPLNVVLVMRDDFYSRLSSLAPELLEVALEARGVLNVPATLTADELDAIVTGPAKDLQVGFEPGLAQRIVSDVLALDPDTAADLEAPVTVLPLLEVALTRLWEGRLDHDGYLTHDAYRRIGAVTGALAKWCDDALRELDQRQKDIAQRILTALVRPADEALRIPAARQQLPLDELRDLAVADSTQVDLGYVDEVLLDLALADDTRAVDEVLAVLCRHRIVTTYRVRESRQPRNAEGTPMAELIHDALVRDWDALRGWVKKDARFHAWRHRLQDQYARWQEHRNPQDLPAGTLLAEGMDWSTSPRLPADLKAFLSAGHRRQQTAVRRSRRLNTVLTAALALALIASGVAFWQRQTAITAQQAAQSRQLAAQSASLSGTNSDLAALLAVAAYRTSPTAEAAASLSTAANFPLRQRIPDGGLMFSVAFSPDGHTLATASHDNIVRLRDVATGSTKVLRRGPAYGAVLSVAFSPDGRTLATANDNIVRLWDVATGKAGTTFIGHTSTVLSVAFSPDGHTLATAGSDGTARLWDVATGKEIATLTGHTSAVTSVAFSPDGRTLATASYDGTARLWDVATGKAVTTFTGHTSMVLSVAFSPDGRTLATASYDRTVRLWDAATGKTITILTSHDGPVTSVAFSPDGRTLATASNDNTVRLWDAATSKEIATLTGHTSAVTSVAFSPDGRTLATASNDRTVRLWDMATGKAGTTFSGHVEAVTSVAFSSDRRTLATAGNDNTVRLWDVGTGRAVTTLHATTSVAFSPDGRTLATASNDNTVRLWDAATGKTITILTSHDGPVTSVAFSPDGRTLATASNDNTVRLWDAATSKEIATLTGHTSAVTSVAFSPDGRTLATASNDRTVRLWDMATGKAGTTFSGHVEAVTSVAFSSDRRTLATAGNDNTVRLWDVGTGRAVTTLHATTSVAFSPDGRTLATASNDNTVRLWDAATGKTITILTSHDGPVTSVAFSPDGRTLATASNDNTVRLWDAATGKAVTTFTGHTSAVNSVAFSPDGRTLATASNDNTARLWDVATGKAVTTFTGHTSAVNSVAFSPDGRTLATASYDGTARLWDAATGKAVTTFTGHTSAVNSVAFSPDGRTLATASRDRTARLWDVATGKAVTTFTGHTSAVNSVAFSPDGRTLATASNDNTARLWSYTAPTAAIKAICEAVARDLTPEEKSAYLPTQSTETICPE
nr:trypsin-like peptidase domain-containing protein [Streptomyces adustus]